MHIILFFLIGAAFLTGFYTISEPPQDEMRIAPAGMPAATAYAPVVPAAAKMEEATGRSIAWGLFLCVIFTVASAYSGLKVGQVMEAAIPISILAIGLARVYARRSTLLENVNILTIGATSGMSLILMSPAMTTMKPAPLKVSIIFWSIFLASSKK